VSIFKVTLVFTVLLCFGSIAYAAPVGLTSEADATETAMWSDTELGLNVGFIADYINKRKIDIDSGEFASEAYLARIGLSINKRLSIYVDLGDMQDMEYDYVILGEQYNAKFENDLVWGVGVSGLIYRWLNGVEIGANASYRTAEMTLESVTLNNENLSRSALTSVRDGDFQEMQGAIEIAWRTEWFTPYIGAKYSDVEVDADFTYNGRRKADGKNAAQNLGAFIGFSITPDLTKLEDLERSKAIIINFEARFIDEEAFNVGISYTF